MTLDQIQRALRLLRYEGGWSIRGLSKQTGLAQSTIVSAMTTQVSPSKQARLSATIPLIPRYAPQKKRESKRKPGHFKRYLIRYYNLRKWLDIIEKEPGIAKKFPRSPQFNMSRDKAAYACARYDYQMKFHLLTLFGERLKQKKIVMADCYPAESWIERINKSFPGMKPRLFEELTKR